jgi:cbb3-type cytochrome oxidase subunit 3
MLRERLTSGRGRLAVIAATTGVWGMDLLLVNHLRHRSLIAPNLSDLVHSIDIIATIAFIAVTIGLTVSLFRGKNRHLFRWALAYLLFSMLQVIANVLPMVATAGSHQGGGLAGLWDVAAVYMESVLVFMFVYIFLDVSTPGGAFIWPSRQGEEPPEPHIIDYLFISMNVNSTYGPTSEAVMSRRAKLVMALQVLLAIVMLTVLIARSVSSTG